MTAELFISDSGGTTRNPVKVYVADSGGTTRLVQKIYVSDSGGTTRLVYQYASVLTMVAGGSSTIAGYSSGSYGTLTPTTLQTGNTVLSLYYETVTHPTVAEYTIFVLASASNPGSTFLTSLALSNGYTLLGSSAGYSYVLTGGGQATWTWTDSQAAPIVSGDTYTVTVQVT